MILMTAVVVDRGGGRDNENNKGVKMAETVREAADNGNGW
jgi:hypothetical protein